MVEAASKQQISRFVCIAGILAHYVGDACQVLHGSYLNDGDPEQPQQREVHHRDGTVEVVKEPLGKGVHSAYESNMINDHIGMLMGEVDADVGKSHGMPVVQGGQEAGFATVELMKRTRNRIDPMALVKAFAAARQGGKNTSEVLWNDFGEATCEAIVDGCQVLAMLWDSAWREGNGQAIADNHLRAVTTKSLITLYSDQQFVPSLPLDEIDPILQG